MAICAILRLLGLVVGCIMLVATRSGAEITCNQVERNLTPCLPYVLNGGAVPNECCSSVKNVYILARTTTDRQNICTCLKSAVNYSGFDYNSFNLGLAAGLPKKCGVNIPYKIDPSTDCSRVS